MDSRKIRILIADDQVIVAQALALCLEREADFEVVGLASSGKGALSAVQKHSPDVLILDNRMPDMDGLDVLAKMLTFERRPCVLMFTAFPVPGVLKQAMALGATGFLSKELGLRAIPPAIRAAFGGKAVLHSNTLQRLFAAGQKDLDVGRNTNTTPTSRSLAGREQAVLILLSTGMNNDDIGRTLGIQPGEVGSHLAQILEKTGASSRTQAVVWAYEHGLAVSA